MTPEQRSYELYCKWSDEAEPFYDEWEKGRPCTPSDYPDEHGAYIAGYAKACEIHNINFEIAEVDELEKTDAIDKLLARRKYVESILGK